MPVLEISQAIPHKKVPILTVTKNEELFYSKKIRVGISTLWYISHWNLSSKGENAKNNTVGIAAGAMT